MSAPGRDEPRRLGDRAGSSVEQAAEAISSFPHETPIVVDGALSRLIHDERDLTAAFAAGRLFQEREAVEEAAEARARDLLLAQSSEWQRWSRALALRKGPAWAAMIDQAAEL